MFPSVATIVVLGVMAAYVYLLARSVEAGLCSLLAVTLFDLSFGLDAHAIGRLHLSALDLIYLCLLVAGFVRFVHSLRFVNTSRGIAIAYLLIFAASLAGGIVANGVFAAANEARGFVGPLLALLYFSDASIHERSLKRYCGWYLVFGTALCGVAALAAMGLPVGVAAWTHSSMAALDHRYLPASAAAVIVVCAFFSLGLPDDGRCVGSILAPLLFLFVGISLRHRTVWAMMLAGTAVLSFLDGYLFRRVVPSMLLALVAVGAVVLYGSAGSHGPWDNEFGAAVSDVSTWEWRVSGWRELIGGSDRSAYSIVFGQLMGSGWLRIDASNHHFDLAPPHSEYVTQYLRVGSIGLMLISLFALAPLRLLRTGLTQETIAIFPYPAIWGAVTLMILVYGITYSIEPESYALIGFANAIASDLDARRRAGASAGLIAGEVRMSSDLAL
jgi:hypothetical protein